jgi:hypothetical protein
MGEKIEISYSLSLDLKVFAANILLSACLAFAKNTKMAYIGPNHKENQSFSPVPP